MAKKITIGNAIVSGFVNLVADKRIVVGSGSYKNAAQETVFKESITAFFDDKFDGEIPKKGDYVKLSGDLTVQERKDNAEVLNATFNARFKNQVEVTEAPKKKEAAPATAGADDDI